MKLRPLRLFELFHYDSRMVTSKILEFRYLLLQKFVSMAATKLQKLIEGLQIDVETINKPKLTPTIIKL